MSTPSSAGSAVAPRKVTVVVIVYNGGDLLLKCLAALASATMRDDVDLVLLDNASCDGAFECAATRFPGARLVHRAHNGGFAAGVNDALAAVCEDGKDSDVAVLVNQDCIVEPGWLGPLESRLREPSVGVVGARILDPDRVTLQHAGGTIEANGLTRHIGRGTRDQSAYSVSADVEYVTGALFGFRLGTWRAFGPFDHRYFPAYFEETDFCVRVRCGGKRVVYEPGSVAVHHEASSSGGPTGRHFLRHYHRGRLRFAAKHLFVPGKRLAFLGSELRWLAAPKSLAHFAALARAYARVPMHMLDTLRSPGSR